MPAWSIGCRCFTTGSIRCSITWRVPRSYSNRWPRTPPTSGSVRSRTITRRASKRSPSADRARLISRCRPTGSTSSKPNGGPGSRPPRWHGSLRSRYRKGRGRSSTPAPSRGAISLSSEGARERMRHVLADHALADLVPVQSWPQVLALPPSEVALAVLGLESGFETAEAAVIGEQDILGDRLVRPRRASKRAENFIAEVTSLSAGDLVVHVDHGIGRFVGLRAIEAAGAPHDCLEIHYAGGDKLFLPVENIELLSRYGSEDTHVELDRLGGGAWQARKARMKSRIREIANELIKIAAERQLREAPRLTVEHGPYDEFCAGFPYEETDDQQVAIDTVLGELASGRPMDRLICGDVGFGKTEVALRAAFVAAMNGRQVAVVVPTTLLARQHTKTFADRFRGLPVL